MRISDLSKPIVAESTNKKPTPTVQRLLETRDDQFGPGMTGKELMEWVKSL